MVLELARDMSLRLCDLPLPSIPLIPLVVLISMCCGSINVEKAFSWICESSICAR